MGTAMWAQSCQGSQRLSHGNDKGFSREAREMVNVYVYTGGLVLLSALAREVSFYRQCRHSEQVKVLRKSDCWVLIPKCNIDANSCKAQKTLWKRGQKGCKRWREVLWNVSSGYDMALALTHELTAAEVNWTWIAWDQQFSTSGGRAHETSPPAEDLLLLNGYSKKGSHGYCSF